MNRVETIELIKTLVATYPQAAKNISDVEGLVDSWLMTFAEDEAMHVYKAARLHMSTSKWFPQPSEIKASIGLASLMYNEVKVPTIEAGEPENDWEVGCDICPYAELGCRKEVCIV